MTLTQAREYLKAYAEATDEPNLAVAINTVCGTVEKPTFIITADDRLATITIRFWINALASLLNGASSIKIEHARACARAIALYQRNNKTEVPR